MRLILKRIVISASAIASKAKHFLVLAVSVVMVGAAYANPEMTAVTSGNVSVTQTTGSTVVNQASQKAIIEWKTFNIGASEKTQFIQPNASATALNRIDSSHGVSQIFGSLSANGKIILINQAGIYFGPGAHVDVGGMIASTADMTNANFLAGNYIFSGAGSGVIINEGSIKASDYGLIALIGNKIANSGLIQAKLGSIVLASGSGFTLDFYGDQLINFLVTDSATVSGKVENTGSLLADGGKILVSAKAVQGVLDSSINMQGLLQAKSVAEVNGEIILSTNAAIKVGGTINVSGYLGGAIDVLGSTVHLTPTSRLYAYGTLGGGNIRVGGDAHGVGSIQNALMTIVDAGSILNADAIQNGRGGQVIVWSDNNTQFHGSISAQGGALGGDGGFAETSGGYLNVVGAQINLLASQGATGTWLLDPSDVTITTGATSSESYSSPNYTPNGSGSTVSNINANELLTNLNSTNVTVLTTNGSGTGNGDIAVNTALTWTSGNTLTLSAARNIYLNADITALFGGLTLSAVNGSQSISAGTIGSGTIGGTVGTQTANINVYNFILSKGQWFQNAASLPVFSVTNNFQIAAGSVYNSTFNAQFTRLITTGNAIADVFGLQGATTAPTSTNYLLNNNIDATVTKYWSQANGASAGFIPIGNVNVIGAYTGTFNGANKVISNLYIYIPTGQNGIGLFGFSQGAISNIGLSNVNITGYMNTGGLVGEQQFGSISNSFVLGGSVTSTSSTVGGLVGALVGAAINTSYSTPSVQTTKAAGSDILGGLVGFMAGNSSIDNSYSTGSVTVISTGNYFGTGNYMGGLVGSFNFLSPSGNSTITKSYATGRVSGDSNNFMGGLIGKGANNSTAVVSNSFWDTETTGMSVGFASGSGFGGGTGNSGSTFSTTLASLATYTGVGWSMTATPSSTATKPSETWFIFPGGTRPLLMMEYNTSISNAHQLQLVGSTLGANYTVASNVDMSSSMTNASDVWGTNSNTRTGKGFVPIALGSNFTGSLNGGNNVINNLYINLPSTNNVALFSSATANPSSTVFQNLGLTNVNITGGNAYTAALVGDISGTGTSLGAGNILLNGIYVTGSVTAGSTSSAGGLVGNLGGNSTTNYGYIINSYNAATVTGVVVGGIVANDLSGTILNSYNIGTISGTYYAGGIVGQSCSGCAGTQAITNSYNSGLVTAPFIAGAIIANNNGIAVTNSFYDTTTSGAGGTGSGLTTANMMLASNFTGWNISSTVSATATPPSSTWFIFNGQTRPMLMMEYNTVISNAHQLQLAGSTLGASYTLASNIDLTSNMRNSSDVWGTNRNISTGAGFVPIGTGSTFSGTFDGQSRTINGLYINTPSGSQAGLFSATNYATLRNLGLTNVSITGTDSDVGGFVGHSDYTSSTNLYITGTVTNINVYNAGGIFGTMLGGSLSNSYNAASILSNNTSGVTVGGLVGLMSLGATISNSYNIGSVTVTTGSGSSVGGLVGALDVFFTGGTNTISKSYSTGLITAVGNIGGLVGYAQGISGGHSGTISNSFWDTATSGQASAVGACANAGTCGSTTGGIFNGTNSGSLAAFNTYNGASWNISSTVSTSTTAPTSTWFIFNGQTRPLLMMEYSTTISTPHQLQLAGSTLGASYTLANNIDLSSSMTNASDVWGTNRNTPTGAGFAPIGSSASPFLGIFDGAYSVISNLYINLPSASNVGMFGVLGKVGTAPAQDAYVKNIGIVNATVNGASNLGVIAGSLNAYGNITNSYATGNITSIGSNASIGGLVGYNLSFISNSYSNVTVYAPGSGFVGGIVGLGNDSTNNNPFHGAYLLNVYSLGNVTGNSAVGGIQGQMGGYNGGTWGAMINAYASGLIVGNSSVAGITFYGPGNYGNLYYNATLNPTVSNNGATGLTTTQLMQLSSYSNWNISSTASTTGTPPTSTWFIFNGQTRPMLMMEYSTVISNAHQLQLAGSTLGASYTLANNIDLISAMTNASDVWGTNTTTSTGTGFYPIAGVSAVVASSTDFTGIFNGNNYIINNLYINLPSKFNVGLFGNASGKILNVGLTNANITGFDVVGGLVGNLTGTASYTYVGGSVTGTNSVPNMYGTGGLVGGLGSSGKVEYSYSSASVTGPTRLGGLVGQISTGTISNSYSTGSVTGTLSSSEYIGGLVGASNWGGASTIINSYSTGSVGAPSGVTNIGGLIGGANGGTYTNVFWDTETSVGLNFNGITSSGSTGAAGYKGMTTAQMMTLDNFTTSGNGFVTGSGWSIASASTAGKTWGIISGTSYPYLTSFYAATPRVISGTVTGASAGSIVTLAANSVNLAISSAANTISYNTTKTSSNGFYYFLEGNGVIADTVSGSPTTILAYLTSGGTANAVTVVPATSGASITGLNLTTGQVTVGDNNTGNVFSNSILKSAISTPASLTSSGSNILYSVSGSAPSANLTFTNTNTKLSIVGSTTNYIIDGAITAIGSAGTLSFAGPVTINNNNSAIASGANQTYSGTITLSSNATFTDSNSIGGITFAAITGGGNSLTINTAGTSSISGVFSGTNSSLVLNANSATGTLILTGANNYTGTTTITAGTLQVGSGATGSLGAGAVTNNGTLTFGLTAAQTVSNAIGGTGALNQNGSGAITLTGSNNYSGLTTIALNSTLQIGNNGTTGSLGTNTVNNNGFLIFNLTNGTINPNGSISSSTTVANTINGSGTVTQAGSGVLQLSGTNGFTGGSNVTSGSLVMNNGSALGSGNITINSGTTLMVAPNATINNTITWAGTLLPFQNAAGTTLAGMVTITGNNAVLGSATEDINTTNFNIGNVTKTSGGLSGSGTLTSNLSIPGGTVQIYGVDGASNFTGTLNLNGTGVALHSINSLGTSAATVQFTAASASLNVVANQIANVILNASGLMQLVSGATWAGNVTLNGSTTLTVQGANSGSGIISGQITGSGGVTLGNNGASGIVIFSNSNNTYSGVTNLAGFTLSQGVANATSPNSLINVNGGTLSLNGFDNTTGVGGLTGSGTVSLGSNTLKTNDSGSNTFSGSITGVNGSFIKAGSGTLTLSGANSYTGLTTVNAGTLQSGTANIISASSNLSIAGGAVFDLNNFDNSIGSVTGTGNITLGTANLTVGTNNTDTSYSGVISGAGNAVTGALTKVGSGNLTLGNDNTYTGDTNINFGILTLGSANAIPAASTINLASSGALGLGYSKTVSGLTGSGNINISNGITLTINNTANNIYSGALTGEGNLIKQGTGTLTLSGANNYSGNTEIQAGLIVFTGSNSTLGNISVASGSSLQISGVTLSTPQLSLSGGGVGGGSAALLGSGTAVLLGNISLAADSVLGTNLAADSLTVSGVINGAYALSINTGAITLGGAIGATIPLASLTDNAATTFINGGSVATSGNQTYNSAIIANNTLSLTASAVYLNGGGVTTAGTQTYNAPVILGANTSLIATDNISLTNGISGAYALSLVGSSSANNNFLLSGGLATNSIVVTGGSGGANALSVQTNTQQTWSISNTNTGNITGAGSNISFANIQNIVGDALQMNTLTTSIANNTWSISGSNSGVVTGLNSFSNMQNIMGGGTSNTFVMGDNGSLSGTLNGGANIVANTLDYAAYSSPVNLTITSDNSGRVENSLAAFVNIGSVIGNGSGTLTVAMVNQKINITNAGVGYVADPINFSNFVNFNGYNSTRVIFLAQANLVSQGNGFFTATMNGVTLSFVNTTGYSGMIAGATPAQTVGINSVMNTATANPNTIAPVTAQQTTTVLSGSAAEASLQNSITLGNFVSENVTTISNSQQTDDADTSGSQKISTNCI